MGATTETNDSRVMSRRKNEVAQRVFDNPAERKRLEALVHPLVFAARDRLMKEAVSAVAFVWDTPLLFETGLDRSCDSIVFVDAPEELRQDRLRRLRGWEARELLRREKAQLPLDKKRSLAHYVVENTADAAFARRQVEDVLSQILRSR
jgi:dephospho-CoA kinase